MTATLQLPPRPHLVPPAGTPCVCFTLRELQILHELLKSGEDNQAIADRLYLSIETVKTHMRKIYRKAGVDNRTELVIRLLKQQIVPTDIHDRVIDVF